LVPPEARHSESDRDAAVVYLSAADLVPRRQLEPTLLHARMDHLQAAEASFTSESTGEPLVPTNAVY
jgi:hypothetical protein